MKIEYIGVSSAAFVLGGIFTVLGVGLLETIMLIVLYAIIGLIVGLIVDAICAWAFNHSSKLFGGIEIKVKE